MEKGYTFDDILLVPQYSSVLPCDVDTSTYITSNIKLNIPLISSAMDMVTESDMAIGLAKEGGIGIIHRNISTAQQAAEIRRVKKYESWIVSNPVTISPDDTVGKVLQLKQLHGYSGLPVVDSNGKLIGVLTNRDVRFVNDNSIKVSDLMTSDDLVTVREGISYTEAKMLLHKHKLERLLVVDEGFRCVGLITVKDISHLDVYPSSSKDSKSRLIVGAAVSVSDGIIERASMLIEEEVDILVIDTAHAHTKIVGNAIKLLKDAFPEVPIIAGNIATYEAAKFLVDMGVDAVKVGIGPGSICTTRVITGVGYPQFSAIVNVAKACKGTNVKVIADGGIRYSGDIAKSIAAGADCVMIGSLFAGTKESPGDIILYQGRSYKRYRGMGSIGSMNMGSADRYFQNASMKLVPEGVEGMVPFKGSLTDIVYQLVGGLKSSMGYTGNSSIEQMKEHNSFVTITQASQKEGHPHDILITKDSPNYAKE